MDSKHTVCTSAVAKIIVHKENFCLGGGLMKPIQFLQSKMYTNILLWITSFVIMWATQSSWSCIVTTDVDNTIAMEY